MLCSTYDHVYTMHHVCYRFHDIILLKISLLLLQLSSSMRGKTLDAISDSLIKAGGFLQMIQSDKKRLDCLRVFASALEIVEWIRKETRGI